MLRFWGTFTSSNMNCHLLSQWGLPDSECHLSPVHLYILDLRILSYGGGREVREKQEKCTPRRENTFLWKCYCTSNCHWYKSTYLGWVGVLPCTEEGWFSTPAQMLAVAAVTVCIPGVLPAGDPVVLLYAISLCVGIVTMPGGMLSPMDTGSCLPALNSMGSEELAIHMCTVSDKGEERWQLYRDTLLRVQQISIPPADVEQERLATIMAVRGLVA